MPVLLPRWGLVSRRFKILAKVELYKLNGENFKLMAEENGFSGGMQDVSDMKIKCADCGKDITELPFRPKEGQEVRCTDCFRKKKDEEREARMIDVSDKNITCASCGKKIEKLPFEPSGDRPVYCSDCYRK